MSRTRLFCLATQLVNPRRKSALLNTLTLVASELDFTEPGELSLFIDESQLGFLEDVMWTRGYLDGKEMAGAFTLLHSKDLVWSRMVHDYLMGQRAPQAGLVALYDAPGEYVLVS